MYHIMGLENPADLAWLLLSGTVLSYWQCDLICLVVGLFVVSFSFLPFPFAFPCPCPCSWGKKRRPQVRGRDLERRNRIGRGDNIYWSWCLRFLSFLRHPVSVFIEKGKDRDWLSLRDAMVYKKKKEHKNLLWLFLDTFEKSDRL